MFFFYYFLCFMLLMTFLGFATASSRRYIYEQAIRLVPGSRHVRKASVGPGGRVDISCRTR